MVTLLQILFKHKTGKSEVVNSNGRGEYYL